jgi:hypothetical protein
VGSERRRTPRAVRDRAVCPNSIVSYLGRSVPQLVSRHSQFTRLSPRRTLLIIYSYAVKNNGLTLDIVKNIVVLYGIFELEINRWVSVDRRLNNNWTQSLRDGSKLQSKYPQIAHIFFGVKETRAKGKTMQFSWKLADFKTRSGNPVASPQ